MQILEPQIPDVGVTPPPPPAPGGPGGPGGP